MQFSWRSVFEYSLSRLIPAVVALVAISVYTHLFIPAEFGQYSIILAIIAFLTLIGTTQIRPIILRFFASYKSQGKLDQFFVNIVSLHLVIAIIVSLAVLLIKLLLQKYFPSKYIEYIYIIIFLYFFSSIFESLVHFFRANNEAKKFAFLWITYSLLRHGGAIALCILFTAQLQILFTGFILSAIIIDLIIIVILLRKYGLNFKLMNAGILREKIKFAFPLMISTLAFWFFTYSDRFIIELIRGSSEVGLYTAGFTIAERGLKLILAALMLHAYPLLSSIYEQQDKESTSKLLSDLSEKYILLAVPLLIMISLLSKDIVDVYLHDDFKNSSIILPMITFSFCLIGLSEYVSKGFELTKKTKSLAYIAIVSGLIGMSCNLFAIYLYGYIGAGIVAIISSTIYLSLMIVYVQQHLRWAISLKFLLKLSIPVLLLILIILVVKYSISSSIFRILAATLMGGAAYAFASKLIKIL